MSNKSFKEKRDMDGGFADSPLRLNRGLGKLDTWNGEEFLKEEIFLQSEHYWFGRFQSYWKRLFHIIEENVRKKGCNLFYKRLSEAVRRHAGTVRTS